MRVSVEAGDLRRVVNLAATAVRKSHAPILECIHIRASDNSLYAIGVRPDAQITATAEAATVTHGECSVNARDLKYACGAASGCVTLELVDHGLKISGNISTTIPTMVGDIPEHKIESPIEVDGGVDAFIAAAGFCDTSSIATYSHCVFFHNGHVYSSSTSAMIYRQNIGATASGAIHADSLDIIRKVGGRLFLGGEKWMVEAEGVRAVGLNYDAQPPQYDRVFSGDFSEIGVCDASLASAAIDAATLGRAREVFFHRKDGIFVAEGSRFDNIHAESFAQIPLDGQGADFLLSTAFARRAFASFPDRVVSIRVSGPAIIIKPEGLDAEIAVAALRDNRTNLPEPKQAA